jgi:hypothetical protein
MQPTPPSSHAIAIAVAMFLAFLVLICLFARGCICDKCGDSYAIYMRDDRQLCRKCRIQRDRLAPRRRSFINRILKRAA